MRNLPAFNQALLAKQVWRIVKYPNSFMAKTLKNKYFPHSSLMDVKVSSLASYTWRSLLSARGLLQRGIRKVIGDGSTINMWKDPWVPSLPKFRLLTQGNRREDELIMVSELMAGREWDDEKLRQLFTAWEVAAIRSIPIPRYHGVDEWTWHYSKHGDFTVKSAYYLELEGRKKTVASSSGSVSSTLWKRVWKSILPSKVKLFGWRAIHGGLATRENLMKWGMEGKIRCPMCGEASESIMHTFLDCEEAKRLWKLSPLRLESNDHRWGSFREWCIDKAKIITDEHWWTMFWSLLWQVWLRRNAWVFRQTWVTVEDALNKAMVVVREM